MRTRDISVMPFNIIQLKKDIKEIFDTGHVIEFRIMGVLVNKSNYNQAIDLAVEEGLFNVKAILTQYTKEEVEENSKNENKAESKTN